VLTESQVRRLRFAAWLDEWDPLLRLGAMLVVVGAGMTVIQLYFPEYRKLVWALCGCVGLCLKVWFLVLRRRYG
jgi:hypothetical protein